MQHSKLKNNDDLMRPAEQVMRLERLGSSHQTRLSFMRTLLRRLKSENWRFERPVWSISASGEGHAVYSAHGPLYTYSLVAFAHVIPPDQRSDRVIATAWDTTFCLFDGVPTVDDIERLSKNVPYQEAGRISDSELSLSRANRSVRLFQHVLDRLAEGKQPDLEQIQSVGYLLRTTAVYGSGKFGAADRFLIQDRELARGPFRLEMLSVYLTRAFSLDLVEYMAAEKGGDKATTIDPALRRRFGIGNSTGLGMAPFLVNHPCLFNNWISARETAFARVRSEEVISIEVQQQFLTFLKRAILNVDIWNSSHELQQEKIKRLKADLKKLSDYVNDDGGAVLKQTMAWNKLSHWTESNLSLEGQEQFLSLMIEPYGELVDGLTKNMGADEYTTFRIDGSQSISTLIEILEENYQWALKVDYVEEDNCARFWYVSEEKLEPRLGERFEESGTEYEQPLSIGRDASALYATLKNWMESKPDQEELAYFLLAHSEHRHIVRRVQLQANLEYSEIQDKLISCDLLPIDMLRSKLAFFGATHFDPRSDRWVRICLYKNAPFPHELADSAADDWAYPPLDTSLDPTSEV